MPTEAERLHGFKIDDLDHRTPRTASALRSLQRAGYAAEARLIGFEGIPPLKETTEAIRALDLRMLGVVAAHRLVAALGWREHAGVVDIDRLVVDPQWFRRGIGRALVHELRSRYRDIDLTVSTAALNIPAIKLYESEGFREVARVHGPLEIVEFRRAMGG